MRAAILLALAALTLTLGGCGGDEEGAEAAIATFVSFRESLRERDYGRTFDLLSAEEIQRVDEAAARLRAEVARRGTDAEAAGRVTKIAEAFGVEPDALARLSTRELWTRGTEVKGDASELRRWAEAELDEPPKIQNDVAVLVVRMVRGPREVIHLVREDGRWRVSLRRPRDLPR